MSDAGGNFVSEKFKEFYKNLSIKQAISLLYHHQGNGQVGMYIKSLSGHSRNVSKLIMTDI